MNKEKITMEFIINSPISSLFTMISTSSGLEKWFAPEVKAQGDSFTFIWNRYDHQKATRLSLEPKSHVCFQWEDDKDTPYTFEMRVTTSELTKVVSLEVIEYVEPDEEEDVRAIWDENIKKLRRKLGSL